MQSKSFVLCLAGALALFLSPDAFGVSATVRSRAEFLGAVAKASDGKGLLVQDLDVVFAADCAPIKIGEDDIWNQNAKCLLDCGGHRITLDAGGCPGGTVVIGGNAEGGRREDRSAAIKGCGRESVFRNLTFVNQGRLEFASVEGTRVKDCDFIGCGPSSDAWAGEGGAVKGCGIVEGCGFERCRARVGGALSDCGYVVECLFVDCRALDGGGAIAGAGDVSRCEFRSCGSEISNGGVGGAIYGGRDVVSCLFVDCTAKQGGAIMSAESLGGQHPKVVHCTFIRCRGEQNDEAVFESSADSPLFMLNCLSYGSAMLQEGADEADKFGCYCLEDDGFFADYAKGDFHPNPALPDSWEDPCGLRFGESGAAVFVCRDLDGFGYQLSSPWPVCPGCYRFRAGDGVESASPESAGKDATSVVKPRKGAKPGHWRVPPKRAPVPANGFWSSVRNSPPHVVSQRTTGALLDLSKLPCEIVQNEIVHGGDNYLDFVSTWYEGGGFSPRCGPLKMPEVGVTPGYGCPGRISPYEEDDELKTLARKYRFRTGWFHRGFPKEGDPAYSSYKKRLECWERKTNDVLSCYTCTVEKIPFLFSPAPGRGPMPLVVYIAGSGEQGTDLKKMFRQTGVFDAVRDPSFVFAHPCHLLAIMPPDFATRASYLHFPHRYSFCSNPPSGDPPANLDLLRMYADLVFELQRELESKGRGTIDPNAIVLTGLGSGASAALSMMREYPGRYAGVCATYPSWQFLLPAVDRYRPGRWWFALSEAYHEIDDKVNTMAEAYGKAGADVRVNYYQNGDNWWNAQYSSPEFKSWIADCCDKGPLHGEKLIVARPESGAELLLAKTGPDEAMYYGTVEERPEGLPSEVADKRIKDIRGIRYLYVGGSAGEIPPDAFMQSADLETVHIKSHVTNIAARAFAESPKLNLVVFEDYRLPRIAVDAFDGCSPALYGGTIGVPVEISWGVTKVSWGPTASETNTTVYGTRKISLKSHALPVDGLFSTHLFLCDDQLHRRLHIEGDFLWSEEGEDGANALMFLGEGRDVFVPDTLGGRPVVALGRNLLHRRWGGFEYGILAIPATVRSMPLFPGDHKVSKVFAACKLGFNAKFVLSPETVVYGTTPDETTGRLVPSWIGWEGKEVVVPRGTNPREFFKPTSPAKRMPGAD
ncbi:MAG: hypothetical protein IJI73_01380 [Kiritimatiellae bacterium]|nr:hypothetical protein [Kiritimatiellia bacterium]